MPTNKNDEDSIEFNLDIPKNKDVDMNERTKNKSKMEEFSHSFKAKEDISRTLFGTSENFYFTTRMKGFVGHDETRSSVYEGDGKGLLCDKEINIKKGKRESMETSNMMMRRSTQARQSVSEHIKDDIDALEFMVENMTSINTLEDIEDDDNGKNDNVKDVKVNGVDDKKDKGPEYYDAMSRLGPSMNMVDDKLHDIRSLSSSRRLGQLLDDQMLDGKEVSELAPKLKSDLESQRNHIIDLRKLRRLASQGIPDKGSHRAVTWRVLLGYLPVELSQWEDVLKKERDLYRKLVCELFVHPSHQQPEIQQPIPTPQDVNVIQAPSGELLDGTNLRNQVNLKKLRGLSKLNARSIRECNARVSYERLAEGEKDSFIGSIVEDRQTQHNNNDENDLNTSDSSNFNASCDLSVFSQPADNPLSVDDDSKWAQFFENASVLDEIRKDVVRTHPDLHFFLEPERNLGKRRYAALERILFVWAKLNHGVKYVQGMNEIVGTIYFVIATDFNEEWACEAEADTYFLFNLLMDDMRDIFIPQLDNAETGIQGRIAYFKSLLSLHDPEVRCHLDDLGIDASFFAVRWLTTLLSREFLLPDTIRLWDSMFASTHKDNFIRYVCVTMVMFIRQKLLQSDFSASLRLLQSYPPTDVGTLLETSRALWIYESQITLACHRGGVTLKQALNAIAPPENIVMAYGLIGGLSPSLKKRNTQSAIRKSSVESSVGNFTSTTQQFFNGFFRTTQPATTNDSSNASTSTSSGGTTTTRTTKYKNENDLLDLSSSSTTYFQNFKAKFKPSS